MLAVCWHRWRGLSWSSTGAVLDWDHAGSAVAGGGIMKPSNLRTSRLILETRDAQAARGTVD